MRQKLHPQMAFAPALVDHEHARELDAMSTVLDAHPEVLGLVFRDLPRGKVRPRTGRPAMSAEQVLRAALVKQMHGFSYQELAFHLADSLSFRTFCRLEPFGAAPRKSALQLNIKRVTDRTWEAVHQALVGHAMDARVEDGKTVRFDCTVTETDIHDPSDEALLWDVVRVLTRLMSSAREEFGLVFSDRTRRARRRTNGVRNAKNAKVRKWQYVDLIAATEDTISQARRIASELDNLRTRDMLQLAKAEAIRAELTRFLGLGRRVVSQTRRRVIGREIVPAGEKVVSIFEPHTDIIVKDRRDTLYGHKLCLATGKSGLVLDVVVLDGNPADSTLAAMMVDRQERLYGRPPRQVAFDGGFASRANLDVLKESGVADVCFSKGRGLNIADMVKSAWVFRKLRDFRAGIEAGISFLKRCFGLTRCTWRSLASFAAYVWASIVAANLLTLARYRLAASG
jgi:IS5 family transposase